VVEPKWLSGRVSVSKQEAAHVFIEGDDYLVCKKYAFHRWSNQKKGPWGSGILNSEDDERRTERLGLIGEMAFAKLTGLPVDVEEHQFGDQYDFMVRDVTMDIKLSSNGNHGVGFLKIRDNDVVIPLKCRVYIFGVCTLDDRERERAGTLILGYQTREWIELNAVEAPGRAGDWTNLEIPFNQLIPIRDLIEQIKNVV